MIRSALAAPVLALALGAAACAEDAPFFVSDYDGGNVYIVRDGAKRPVHGLREAWVFNRAMTWLDAKDGADALVCYSTQAPLLLTGRKQVSRWFAGPGAEIADEDDARSRFVKRGGASSLDHVSLPPVQYPIEQLPRAELEVMRATHPWQLLVVVKGRSGPPLYASPWQAQPGRLDVDLLDLYRRKGYGGRYAQFHFILFVRTTEPQDEATVVFRLRLPGRPAVVPSLPVIRTAARAEKEGVPVCAVVLDENANRLGAGDVAVTAAVGGKTVALADAGGGVWKGLVRGLPVGEYTATIAAAPKGGGDLLRTTLGIRITDGQFLGYEERLKLLALDGKPVGPLTGSYRGAPMFQAIGTPQESLVQGQTAWDAVKGDRHEGQYFNHGPSGPAYGFHFWESLTERELDADYAYLSKCGWTLTHLCQNWWVWERLDAGGRLAPHGAEQLFAVLSAAARHGLRLHLAVSHYPLGKESQSWAQYGEAGYRREDYNRPDSTFYAMFKAYLRDLAGVFRDETALSSYTAAGEGDPDCGMTFVNETHDAMRALDPNHLFLGEPHLNPSPYPLDINYYRRDGWKPLLGGMRTYVIDNKPFEHIAVQFKLAGLGHIFLGEGVFWGFSNGARATDRYRTRIRQEFYTGLAYRLPILLSWEERITEDERVVFDQVRRAVDWSKPFARPRLLLRLGGNPNGFIRYEKALSRIPLEYGFLEPDAPAPAGAHVIDTAAPFDEAALAFVSDGGAIPDALRADLPLRIPAGFVASYSWSEDRTTLLAYLQETGERRGVGEAARDSTEAGDYSYIDTTCVVPKDTAIDAWEVECVKPGRIRLSIWRREGDALVRVGEGRLVEMARPGLHRFSLDPPIAARAGDLVGFYIPDGGAHIAAENGGSMLYAKGAVTEAKTPLARWETEPKRAAIRVFKAAEAAAQRTVAPVSAPPAGDIVLLNFPAADLAYRLYDLAEKRIVREGAFRQTHRQEAPAGARHLFLMVAPAGGPR